MTINGVFFDLYGTLLIYGDMESAWSDWLKVFYGNLNKHGLKMAMNDFASECDSFFARPEPPPDGVPLTVYERRILAHCNELGLPLEHGALAEIAATTAGAWQEYITLDPEALLVLRALQRCKKLALISDFDHPPHVHTVLAELRLKEFFDAVTVSGEVGIKKPDPLIFSQALRQTGLQPDEVAYVGDTLNDVRAARAAGLHPILIRRDDAGTAIMDYESGRQPAEGDPAGSLKNLEAGIISGLSSLIELLC